MKALAQTKIALVLLLATISVFAVGCVPQPAQPGPEQPSPEVIVNTPVVTEPLPTETNRPEETPLPETGTSGLNIVYTREANAWIWMEGASPRQLTTHGQVMDVRLSDDGKIVAYLRQFGDTSFELWAVNADGSSDRPLAAADFLTGIDPRAFSVAPHHFDWVPGTHMLAFNTRQVFEGPGLIQYNDLNLVNAVNGDRYTLLPIGEGGDFIYSPDGSQIAISTSEYIVLVNADGTNRRRVLEFTPVNTASEYLYYPSPIWASDSSRLMVVIPPADPWIRPVQLSTLYSLPIDGSPAVQVLEFEAMYVPGYQLLSPDLQYLVFTSEVGTPEENLREVRLVRLSDLSMDLVEGGPLLMSYGWIAPGLFVFSGGEPVQSYISTAELIAPMSLGSGMVQFATTHGEKLVYALGNGSTWTLHVSSEGIPVVIDTFDGNVPTIDIAE